MYSYSGDTGYFDIVRVPQSLVYPACLADPLLSCAPRNSLEHMQSIWGERGEEKEGEAGGGERDWNGEGRKELNTAAASSGEKRQLF